MARKLKVGEWVEVRSKEEILKTLDCNAELDGMPFMPEMFEFCGKRFQIHKRAHKTCDTAYPVNGRRVADAVHLDTRCSGLGHGGCHASCLLFWKTAWLKPVGGEEPTANLAPFRQIAANESLVEASTQYIDSADGLPVYKCQATRLHFATTELKWWEIGQYWEDFTSGNVGIGRILSGTIYISIYKLSRAGIGLGRPIRWLFDRFHFLWGGSPFPRRTGSVPEGEPTPLATLNLQPGELVQIKPFPEILKTLNRANRNRGLFFDAEEVPYCGKQFRVLKRVDRLINERTGRMQPMKTPAVILDGVVCVSRYSECRFFCPREIYPYWREIWLERAKSNT
jgi:hypothetical protein